MKTSLVILASVLLVLGIVGVVYATGDTASSQATVNINEFISVTVDDATITFGSVDAPSTGNVPSNNPLVITVGGETNINYQVTTESDAGTFTGPGTLNDENLKWATTIDGAYTGYVTVPGAQVATGSPGGGSHDLFHKLDIPGGTTAGSYSLDITLTAKNA